MNAKDCEQCGSPIPRKVWDGPKRYSKKRFCSMKCVGLSSARRVPWRDRFWCKVDRDGKAPMDCWEWRATTIGEGYGALRVGGRMEAAHRLSWILAVGPIPDGLHVLHSCDNRLCVNPSHLMVGTHTANMVDMAAKKRGRNLVGEDHGRALLTERRVRAARRMAAHGVRHKDLAGLFGVAQTTMSRAISGGTWRHL